MKRYQFLTKQDIYDALNRVSNALLAAKDGNEVQEILKGLFTDEERLQLGRRILIAEQLRLGFTHYEIVEDLHVGKATVGAIYNKIQSHPKCFELILKRQKKVEKEFNQKKYRREGGSQLVFKKKVYTGITRKDIER
jgi:uncharacterized protein YerC